MSLTPLEKAASGALASVVANTLVYPLDLSKTLIQTQVKKEDKGVGNGNESKVGSIDGHYKNTLDVLQKIYAKKGILGWYHGIFSSLFGTAAQNFLYFYWYTIVKRVHSNLYKHIPNYKPSTFVELFLGALAAAISQLFTMPIGVITTQQQTDKSARPWYQLVKEVLEHDGISGLWKGLRVSLVLCVNPSITYGSYERLRQILFGSKEHLGPLESFSLGMLAKSFATVATQPLIVSKAMMQKKSEKKSKPGVSKSEGSKDDVSSQEAGFPEHEEITFHSFTHALHYLWKTEKHRGLYKGIAPQLMKGVFVQGLLFMFKDQIDLLFLFLLRLIKTRRSRSFK